MASNLPNIKVTEDLESSEFDAIVVVAPSIKSIPFEKVANPLKAYIEVDKAGESGIFVVPSNLPSKKIVFSGTGSLENDFDDVSHYTKAAKNGIKKALATGAKAPLLMFNATRFPEAGTVALLGALEALYVPIEVREQVPEKAVKAETLGIFGNAGKIAEKLELSKALEAGRIVSRDIGGSDPERMAAPKVEEYVRQEFEGSNIKIEVIKGQAVFEQEYPCFAAVNRCAAQVERHDGRIIWLTYEPEGPIEKTLMLVGKGINYDTGGADIKAGGKMAGMSRDKCGSADVAGILKVVSMLKPKNVKVVGAMAMARNSVGSNAYVADEIMTSRAGVRIRVGNTDAEGRMAMVDVLAHMKEKAVNEKNPHLMTIATLTGHARSAVGPYTAVMDNGVANKDQFARQLQATGDVYGDLFEVSTMRKEDYDFIKEKTGEYVDVMQCPTGSGPFPRGHQWAGAFLNTVSGLLKHQSNAEIPLKYSHLDVAGSSGDMPEPTSGSTVIGLSMHFFK